VQHGGAVTALRDTLYNTTVQLIGAEATAVARFGIAVSGGPDSITLLLLAADLWGERLEAATVDHQLRPESGDEAATVRRLCAERGISHITLTRDTPITGSVQAEARTMRYALLEQWRQDRGIDWLMTAHHADDQLETLIMRLNRSSGVAGLSGIRERNGRVLRPLLDVRRETLAAWLADQNITAIDDPSNRNPDFDRARLRGAMAGQNWLDPHAVAKSVRHLAEAEEALAWAAARLAEDRIAPLTEGGLLLDPHGLPPELLRRITLIALDRLQPGHPPRGEALMRALAAVSGGEQTMLGDILLRPDGNGRWALCPAPPRR
jgi:tRNA(Ile)-lysidine synthase